MKTLQALLLSLAAVALFSSCARTYHPLQPASLRYTHHEEETAPLSLGYRYNILTEKRNKKFSKAEKKRRLYLVAVEITNFSDRPMTLGKDFLLQAGDVPVAPVSKMRLYNRLRQRPGFFMFYMFITPLNITTQTTSSHGTKYRFYPLGLIIGPALSFGNLSRAKNNNKKFKADLDIYDLSAKLIAPGETVYGLVGLSHFSFAPLKIYMKDEKQKKKTDAYQDVTDEYYIEPDTLGN